MTPVLARTAKKSAKAKGFKEADGGDHYFYYLWVDGKKTTWYLKVSHGAREMKQREIRGTARVCGMKAPDMYKVLTCEHDKEWVETHYRTSTAATPG